VSSHTFTLYSLLIEKNLCESRKVSVKFPCDYLCLSSRDSSFFHPVRVSSFYSYFVLSELQYFSFPCDSFVYKGGHLISNLFGLLFFLQFMWKEKVSTWGYPRIIEITFRLPQMTHLHSSC
jgi:hypothetical protein